MEVFRNRPFCGLGSMGFCLLLGPIGLFYKMLGIAKLEGSIPCFYQDRSEASVRCQSAFIRLLKVDCGDRFKKSNVPLGVGVASAHLGRGVSPFHLQFRWSVLCLLGFGHDVEVTRLGKICSLGGGTYSQP